MPKTILTTESDEQKVRQALEEAAAQLELQDQEISVKNFEIGRCYDILAIWHPVVTAYVKMAERLEIDDEQRASLNLVTDAVAALEHELTLDQATLERVEAEGAKE